MEVNLRPLFGIAPQRWLPVLLATIGALLLVALFVLPGLIGYGALVTFESRPRGASLYIDGLRVGATPATLFVEAGEHEVVMLRPYHDAERSVIMVPGRLIGSLIAPRRMRMSLILRLDDAPGLAGLAARRFAEGAIIGGGTAQNQLAPVLSTAIAELYGSERSYPSIAADLIEQSMSNIVSASLLKDWMRSEVLRIGAGQTASPHTLLTFGYLAIERLTEREGLASLLAAILPEASSTALIDSDWYRRNIIAPPVDKAIDEEVDAIDPSDARSATQGADRIEIANIDFVAVPGGRFVMGARPAERAVVSPFEIPHGVEIDAFYIMQGEVTRAQYARFLEASPRWRPDRRHNLIEERLVSEGYLADWEETGNDRAVTGVSWHAAQAFAAWVEGQIPATLGAFEVRLPLESEWEWAAVLSIGGHGDGSTGASGARFRESGASEPQPLGAIPVDTIAGDGLLPIADLLGNVWEWMQNWYRPAQYSVRPLDTRLDVHDTETLPGAVRAVRGGSWLDSAREIGISTRGLQPPEWATPYIGFRLVLAPDLR